MYEKHAVKLIGMPVIDVALVVQGQTPITSSNSETLFSNMFGLFCSYIFAYRL